MPILDFYAFSFSS